MVISGNLLIKKKQTNKQKKNIKEFQCDLNLAYPLRTGTK